MSFYQTARFDKVNTPLRLLVFIPPPPGTAQPQLRTDEDCLKDETPSQRNSVARIHPNLMAHTRSWGYAVPGGRSQRFFRRYANRRVTGFAFTSSRGWLRWL